MLLFVRLSMTYMAFLAVYNPIFFNKVCLNYMCCFTGEVGRTLSLIAIYEWNCVTKSLLDATPYRIDSSPPDKCPKPCHEHPTCTECLVGNHGAEGGNQSCVWSTRLQQVRIERQLAMVRVRLAVRFVERGDGVSKVCRVQCHFI